MSEGALELVALYGPAALFAVLVVSAIGLPLQGTLLLLAAGAFVSTGDMELWRVLVLGTSGAVIGDQIGYILGRWGSERFMARLVSWRHGADQVRRAQAFMARWGAAGIFFTRWLVGPLGPWVNLSSGSTAYPWRRFIFWDVLGEVLWVVLYVTLGGLFSDRIEVLAELVGSIGLTLAGAVIATLLVAALLRHLHHAAPEALAG